MKMGSRPKFNPASIYLFWIAVIIVLCMVGIPILSIGSSGGEQKQMTQLAYVYDITVYGLLIISFLSSFIFWKWFKKHWYINSCVFLVCFLLLYCTYWNKEDTYYKDETKYLDKDIITIRTEYCTKNNKIKSIKYWKNDYKDSIWSFYNKKGNIVEERIYQNDTLTRTIKHPSH